MGRLVDLVNTKPLKALSPGRRRQLEQRIAKLQGRLRKLEGRK